VEAVGDPWIQQQKCCRAHVEVLKNPCETHGFNSKSAVEHMWKFRGSNRRPMDSTLKVLQKTCGSTVEPMCSTWESKLNYCVLVHD